MEGIKVGSAYFEIYAKAEQLKAQMADYTGLVKKTADSFEEAFKNAKMDIDNRVLTMKFSQLEGLHKSLLKQLQQKIKLDADVASIERTRIAIKSVEEALIKTKGATTNYGPVGMSFGRIIQDSAYVTQGFGFWINAVGNNITNFAENLSYARARGESFKAMFSGMFTGINAWLTVINIAVSLVTAFALSNRNSKKDVDSHTEAINRQKRAVDELRQSYEDWEKKAKDVGDLMRKLSRGEVDSLNVQKALTIANIALLEAKLKAANKGGVTSYMSPTEVANAKSQLAAYKASLAELNDALLLVEAQFRNAGSSKDEFSKTSFKNEEFGIIAPLKKQLEALEKLKPFATTIQEAADLQEAINAVKNSIEELQAAINIGNRDTNLSGLQPLGLDSISRENKKGSLLGISKEEMDALEEPLKQWFKDMNQEIETTTQNATLFAGAISSGLSQAIGTTENFSEILERVGLQLAQLITQAFLFEGLFALFNPSKAAIGGGGLFSGLFGNVVTAPTTVTPPSITNNFSDAMIVQRLDRLIGGIDALNLNTIRRGGGSSKTNTEDLLKSIAVLISQQQSNMNSDNYKV